MFDCYNFWTFSNASPVTAQYWYYLLALVLKMSLPTCCCTYKEGTSLSSKARFLFQLCLVPGNQGMHHPVYRSVLVVRILFVIILVLRASVLTCGCLFGKELQWGCRLCCILQYCMVLWEGNMSAQNCQLGSRYSLILIVICICINQHLWSSSLQEECTYALARK